MGILEKTNQHAEDRLLFYLARTHLSGETATQAKQLIRDGLDWELLYERARYHRVVPLLHRNIQEHFADEVPDTVLSASAAVHSLIVHRTLFLTRALVKLQELLEAQGFSAIAYKGPALAALAYDDMALRQFADLDILVKHEEYFDIQNFFLGQGYSLADSFDWEYTLIDEDRTVALDVHRKIAPKNFPVSLEFDLLQTRLRPILIGSEQITTFSVEDTLVVLCIQLAKDAWETHAFRLNKLCDIAALIQTQQDLDWNLASKIAKEWGCSRILAFGVYSAHHLLGSPQPKISVHLGISRLDLTFLTSYLSSRLSDVDGSNPISERTSRRFHYKLRERWWDKIYPVLHPLLSKVTPNDKDQEFLALPASLRWLYFLVRPARLAQKFGQRVSRTLKRR